MPKMKSHKGTTKRFRVTGTGKSHILEKKSPKRKRNFRQETIVSAADVRVIKKGLGIG